MASDSFVGDGLCKSPFQEMKEEFEVLLQQMQIARRGCYMDEEEWQVWRSITDRILTKYGFQP